MIQNIPGVIVGTAKDRKRGMTLGELVSFAQAAMSQGAPMDTTVACTSTWRNSIRRLEVPDGTPSPQGEHAQHARRVYEALAAEGVVTRDAFAAALRAAGTPISSERAGCLLRAFKDESP